MFVLTSLKKTLEAYRALEVHASEGNVLNLGVSNIYDPKELEWLISQAREPVKVVQNRWDPIICLHIHVRYDLTLYIGGMKGTAGIGRVSHHAYGFSSGMSNVELTTSLRSLSKA